MDLFAFWIFEGKFLVDFEQFEGNIKIELFEIIWMFLLFAGKIFMLCQIFFKIFEVFLIVFRDFWEIFDLSDKFELSELFGNFSELFKISKSFFVSFSRFLRAFLKKVLRSFLRSFQDIREKSKISFLNFLKGPKELFWDFE